MALTDYKKIKKLNVINDAGINIGGKAQPLIINSGGEGETAFSATNNETFTSTTIDFQLEPVNNGYVHELRFELESVGDVRVAIVERSAGSTVLASKEITYSSIGKKTVSFTQNDYSRLIESGEKVDVIIEQANVSGSSIYHDDQYSGDTTTLYTITLDDNTSDVPGPANSGDFINFLGFTEVVDESKVGTGDIVIDFSDINDEQDLAVYDENGNLLNYHLEYLDPTNEEAVIWVYNSWVKDGSFQAQIAHGDNSSNNDRSNTSQTWSDPVVAYDLSQTSGAYTDLTPNNFDATSVNVSGRNSGGYLGGWAELDGVDDVITAPSINYDWSAGNITIIMHLDMGSTSETDQDFITLVEDVGGGLRFRDSLSELTVIYNAAGGPIQSLPEVENRGKTIFTYTYSSSNNEQEGFFEKNSLGTSNTAQDLVNNLDDIHLGARGDANDKYTNADISHFAIYDGASVKSKDWIDAHVEASPEGGQVFFSQQAAEPTAGFNGTTTPANASGTGETISLSGTTTAATTTANANSSGDTIFIEPDFATLKAVATATGQTTSISGTATINTVAAEATATGAGQPKIRLNLKKLGAATATATGGETQTDRLKGSTDVDGQPTAGVDVNVIDKTNNILYETVTDSDGNWIVDSGSGIKYQVAYLYDDGSVYYGDAEETNT